MNGSNELVSTPDNRECLPPAVSFIRVSIHGKAKPVPLGIAHMQRLNAPHKKSTFAIALLANGSRSMINTTTARDSVCKLETISNDNTNAI